jgi:hypothetical protein
VDRRSGGERRTTRSTSDQTAHGAVGASR